LTPIFLDRHLILESDLCNHRLDVNPEARLFRSTDGGATELEYLEVITALVGVFKPTHLLETGTWNGDGAACLIRAAGAGSRLTTYCDHKLNDDVFEGLCALSSEHGCDFDFIQVNTRDLINRNSHQTWGEITCGKTTFAFLDSSIPDRVEEFRFISDPANGVMDFNRPICVCVHDMSRYRHPHDHHTQFLASTIRQIEQLCEERNWQIMRLHQSRGLMILTWYPDVSGIDGKCIIPDSLISQEDRKSHMSDSDPYLITDYYPILKDIIRSKNPKRILEIGVRYGYSLSVMLDAASHIENAFALDRPINSGDINNNDAYHLAQKGLNTLFDQGRWPNLSGIKFWELDTQSVTALPHEIDQIDVAYIDGDHSASGCLHDLTIVLSRIAPNGLIVVDDADHCRLRPIIEQWAAMFNFTTSYIPDSSGRGKIVVQC
jgi:predicted O-methyltransferase YrrM